ncbi:hypothetical protein [Chryseobacterium sp. ERMR1:04]|uniref:hypothetical protein n=1 Tax=Chryseobacterium sp. ERMR1:04 TaxID=1705393 RepID=UPI000F50EEBC|nr:hypothetical protein [Chryseobacterium sp. ERMR1:04]
MRNSYFLGVLFFGLFSAQKIQVVDAENGHPISNARIILEDKVVYTNEDGFAPIESSSKNFEISASGFKKEKISNFNTAIKLKPSVQDIEEVKIVSVDVKKIFEDVLKNYQQRYYDQPSLYDVVIKEKTFDNNNLYFMGIGEAKIWSKANKYNYRDGYHKRYDDIMQIQLNNVKYLKRVQSDSIFTGKSTEVLHQTLGSYFMNFELNSIVESLKDKSTKKAGILKSKEGDEEVVSFKINSDNGIRREGEFNYNLKDKVITYLKISYLQSEYPTEKRTTTDGREYGYKLGDATLIFDFYKIEGVYVPTMTQYEADNFTIFYKDQVHVKKFNREVVYNTFEKTNQKGLDPKVDFNIGIWKNIPLKEDKAAAMLLSKEEQEFIDQK